MSRVIVISVVAYIVGLFCWAVASDPLTTLDLSKLDWQAVGAVMSGLGAIGAFVAAWAAVHAGRMAADVSLRIADEAKQARFRRSYIIRFMVTAELEFAALHTQAALKQFDGATNVVRGANDALRNLSGLRMPEFEKACSEADLFELSVSISLGSLNSDWGRLRHVFGPNLDRLPMDVELAKYARSRIEELADQIAKTYGVIARSIGKVDAPDAPR